LSPPGESVSLVAPQHRCGNGRSALPAPSRQGLYDPAHERDACGMGFVAHVKGERSNAIVA